MLLKREHMYTNMQLNSTTYIFRVRGGAKVTRDRGDKEEGLREKHYVKACLSNSLFKAYIGIVTMY